MLKMNITIKNGSCIKKPEYQAKYQDLYFQPQGFRVNNSKVEK